MKTTTSLLPLLIAACTNAQSFYNEMSKPFNLVLTSDNTTINGKTLATCHSGAALETLCLSTGDAVPATSFNFNTSTDAFTPNATLGTPGILTWLLKTTSIEVSSSVYFSYDPSTDLAVPVLTPGADSPQALAFDDQDKLNVQGSIDWTANPPNSTAATVGYYRWYACRTYVGAYSYETLAWGLGAAKPENPTCVSVGVKRVFV